ncbi:ATP-binding protein [Aliamphritea hakodatensis]|uniref:ATP-binding protein n=1 Tax=Aliamphritea hakodatensis TaxID=2895352 RepID=UPI0022FD8CE7|nr:ATP-binding protein [Aliamphritea hakodatensis]
MRLRSDKGLSPAFPDRKSHYGITIRMFAGLATMMVFTLIVSLISVNTFRGFQQRFDFVTDEGLPTIITASELGQHSASLVAFAPSLLAARTLQAKETILLQIQDQNGLMSRSISKLSAVGISAQQIEHLNSYRRELDGSFRELGELVSQQIERNGQQQRALRRLAQFRAGIYEQTDRLQNPQEAGRGLSSDQARQLQHWVNQFQGLVILINETASIEHKVVLRRQLSTYRQQWRDLQMTTATLPAEVAGLLSEQLAPVEALITGKEGIFANIAAQFADEEKLYGMFSHHRTVAHRFRAAISTIVKDIEARVVQQNRLIEEQAANRITLLVLVSLLCIAGGGIIFLYIDRSVISRLQRLKNNMYAHAEGSNQPIPLEGNDEITDMAQALRIFVETIQDREEALKSTRNQAKKAEDLLMDAIESAPEGFVLFDPHDNLILCNTQYQALYGFSDEQVKPGTNLQQLLDLLTNGQQIAEPENYRQQRQALKEGRISSLDLKLANGTWLSLLEKRTDRGGTVGIHTRINERKLAEQVLRSAMEKAEAADQAKSKFLAAASHDLRQPLHAMGLFLDELTQIARQQDFAGLVANIYSAHQNMSQMFGDILDLSRLDAGAVTPKLQHFELNSLLQRLSSEFSVTAREKGLDLRSVPTSVRVYSDPAMLERVLRNFIANAVRYTLTGRILIGVRRRGAHLSIQVHDSGIGIPADQQEVIFGEFYQCDSSQQHGRSGLGLGLAITDQLARLLASPVQLVSEAGRGSCFSIRVPAGLADTPAGGTEMVAGGAASLQGQTLILVENDPQVLQAMSQMLSRWGCCVEAFHGPEDLTPQRLAGMAGPLALITDFHLDKNTTAEQVVGLVRQAFSADLPAIIVTADTASEPREAAARLNASLLTKPVRPGKLAALLRQLLRQSQRQDEALKVP